MEEHGLGSDGREEERTTRNWEGETPLTAPHNLTALSFPGTGLMHAPGTPRLSESTGCI